MNFPKRILCPVDFSPLSAHALHYAAEFAKLANGDLTVMYADPFLPPPYFTQSRLAEVKSQFREAVNDAQIALQDFVATHLGAGAGKVAVKVVEALPADGIMRMSRELEADLIVMGTHGRSGANRWLLGSVSELVLRESEIPVLTVRGDATASPSTPQIRKILCPVNQTEAARHSFAVAAQLASCFGAELTALHVKEPKRPDAIADLCAWVPQEVRSHCTVRELVKEGEAAKEIVSHAAGMRCDLLVIGSRHRPFFDSTIIGSTTARVVRHAPCPVLTVKERQTHAARSR